MFISDRSGEGRELTSLAENHVSGQNFHACECTNASALTLFHAMDWAGSWGAGHGEEAKAENVRALERWLKSLENQLRVVKTMLVALVRPAEGLLSSPSKFQQQLKEAAQVGCKEVKHSELELQMSEFQLDLWRVQETIRQQQATIELLTQQHCCDDLPEIKSETTRTDSALISSYRRLQVVPSPETTLCQSGLESDATKENTGRLGGNSTMPQRKCVQVGDVPQWQTRLESKPSIKKGYGDHTSYYEL